MYQRIIPLMLLLLVLSGCYYSHPERLEAWEPADGATIDSVDFRSRHHYWKGFVFETTDTLRLAARPPQLLSDSLLLSEREPLVVTDILYLPSDSVDSVWVRVARDQYTQGWVREKSLMASTAPDEPISRFIHFFSDQRSIIFVSVLGVFILVLILTMLFLNAGPKPSGLPPVRRILRQMAASAGLLAPGGWSGAYRSFYPTLLCLSVAAATTLYCSIQEFVPSTWVEYYFHPTLNPFSPELPPVMQVFVGSVWWLIVVAVAMCIELYREEQGFYVIPHVAGMACVCILIYLVITLTIPIYIGYGLFAAYCIFATLRYLRRRPSRYRCGLCGAPLEELGTCPHCGARNQ